MPPTPATFPALSMDELTIPASTDDPHFADFQLMVDVRNAIETATIGTHLLNVSAVDLLPTYLETEHRPRRAWLLRAGGEPVGRALIEWSTEAGDRAAWPSVEVLPAYRRRGYGAAALARLEEIAAGMGRTVLQHASIHTPVEGGERIAAPTGVGDVPADDPGVRFLRHHGYELEQVYRISFLDLPVPDATLAAVEAGALARAGDEYRIHQWEGRTPERWLDGMARLRTRMSTDAPSGDLEVTEETWDADRVRASEERAEVSDRTVLTSAVEHLPTGELAGFTQVFIPSTPGAPASQEDTLVLREHRGRNLGTLLKVGNVRYIGTTRSDTTLVTTFNAAENRHMLAVNEAIRFRTAGFEGVWKRDSTA